MKPQIFDIIPMFCIDTTLNKKNEVVNGKEFITRTAEKQRIDAYETKQENLEQTIEKSQLPLWLNIVKYVSAFLFLTVLVATLRAGIETAMKNAPALVLIGIGCGVLWVGLQIFSKIKERKVLEKTNAEQQSDDIMADFQEIQAELDVPEYAVDVDVLVFRYKKKDGKLIPKTVGLQPTPYVSAKVGLFATDTEVHIASLENVHTFDKTELKAITLVDKRIVVMGWNKEESPNLGRYKQYKMRVDNLGNVSSKPYYILEIERDGKRYGIWFPCYELEAFQRVTGLSVHCDSEKS